MPSALTFRQKIQQHFPPGWGPEDILPGVKQIFIMLLLCICRKEIPVEIALEIILNFVATSDNYALNPLGKFDIPNLYVYGGTALCLLTGSPIPPSDWDLCHEDYRHGIGLRDKNRATAEKIGEILGQKVEIVREWEIIVHLLGIPMRVYGEFRAGRFNFSIRTGSGCTSTVDLFESGIFFNLRTGENDISSDFPKYNPRRFRFHWATEEIYDQACNEMIKKETGETANTLLEQRRWFFETQQERFEKHQSRLEKVGVELIKVHMTMHKCISVALFQREYFCKSF